MSSLALPAQNNQGAVSYTCDLSTSISPWALPKADLRSCSKPMGSPAEAAFHNRSTRARIRPTRGRSKDRRWCRLGKAIQLPPATDHKRPSLSRQPPLYYLRRIRRIAAEESSAPRRPSSRTHLWTRGIAQRWRRECSWKLPLTPGNGSSERKATRTPRLPSILRESPPNLSCCEGSYVHSNLFF